MMGDAAHQEPGEGLGDRAIMLPTHAMQEACWEGWAGVPHPSPPTAVGAQCYFGTCVPPLLYVWTGSSSTLPTLSARSVATVLLLEANQHLGIPQLFLAPWPFPS